MNTNPAMPTGAQPIHESKLSPWAGFIIQGLVVLFLTFDCVVKLIVHQSAVDATVRLGYSADLLIPLGIVLTICTLLYVVPQTSILGAILLTAYLGGATSTHVRIGDPFFFPIIMGVLVWLSLFLRDRRLRALIPLRS